MSIKIIALGPKVYASNGINLFDGIITILALIDIGIVYNFSFNWSELKCWFFKRIESS